MTSSFSVFDFLASKPSLRLKDGMATSKTFCGALLSVTSLVLCTVFFFDMLLVLLNPERDTLWTFYPVKEHYDSSQALFSAKDGFKLAVAVVSDSLAA